MLDHGGLARAIMSEDGNHVALVNLEVDVVQNLGEVFAVFKVNMLKCHQGFISRWLGGQDRCKLRGLV